MDASQRSFMSPRDRKALAEKEDRSFMRDLTQDKLASAERVAESQAKGMMAKAGPEIGRYKTITTKNSDGSEGYITIDTVTGQPAEEDQSAEAEVYNSMSEADKKQIDSIDLDLSGEGFFNKKNSKEGAKYKRLMTERERIMAKYREAGRYAAGAAPQQKFDDAVRKYTDRFKRNPTEAELAELRERFGM